MGSTFLSTAFYTRRFFFARSLIGNLDPKIRERLVIPSGRKLGDAHGIAAGISPPLKNAAGPSGSPAHLRSGVSFVAMDSAGAT